jgi:hypothetical protein
MRPASIGDRDGRHADPQPGRADDVAGRRDAKPRGQYGYPRVVIYSVRVELEVTVGEGEHVVSYADRLHARRGRAPPGPCGPPTACFMPGGTVSRRCHGNDARGGTRPGPGSDDGAAGAAGGSRRGRAGVGCGAGAGDDRASAGRLGPASPDLSATAATGQRTGATGRSSALTMWPFSSREICARDSPIRFATSSAAWRITSSVPGSSGPPARDLDVRWLPPFSYGRAHAVVGTEQVSASASSMGSSLAWLPVIGSVPALPGSSLTVALARPGQARRCGDHSVVCWVVNATRAEPPRSWPRLQLLTRGFH